MIAYCRSTKHGFQFTTRAMSTIWSRHLEPCDDQHRADGIGISARKSRILLTSYSALRVA